MALLQLNGSSVEQLRRYFQVHTFTRIQRAMEEVDGYGPAIPCRCPACKVQPAQ